MDLEQGLIIGSNVCTYLDAYILFMYHPLMLEALKMRLIFLLPWRVQPLADKASGLGLVSETPNPPRLLVDHTSHHPVQH